MKCELDQNAYFHPSAFILSLFSDVSLFNSLVISISWHLGPSQGNPGAQAKFSGNLLPQRGSAAFLGWKYQ
jgi:hypothetical protein